MQPKQKKEIYKAMYDVRNKALGPILRSAFEAAKSRILEQREKLDMVLKGDYVDALDSDEVIDFRIYKEE